MKRLFLIIISLCSLHVSAQNAVFPIVNTYSDGKPEFTAAYVYTSRDYMGKSVYLANNLQMWCGSNYFCEREGNFVSFNYVSRNVNKVNSQWFHGGESTQMAFHPGGQDDFNYNLWTNGDMTDVPLYAFNIIEGQGLCLVNLWDNRIVFVIDSSTDALDYVSLSVFAGNNFTDKDMIVMAGKKYFKVFETIPESSGVRQIFSSDKEPTYFGINGQKYDDPQPGLNIVVDGNKTKKIVVK